MHTVEVICCPNCGSNAERHNLTSNQLTRTHCPSCDYLMVTCLSTGKVLEAYAPGITNNRYRQIRLDLLNGTNATVHKPHWLPIPVSSGR